MNRVCMAACLIGITLQAQDAALERLRQVNLACSYLLHCLPKGVPFGPPKLTLCRSKEAVTSDSH
jgi:hypothetical protein